MNSDILNHLSFCVIDLETTGSLPQKDRIIDIGLVRVVNFEIVDEKNFLINPKMKIPHFIQRLTKIKQKDVAKAPVIDDVIDEVVDFIGDSILVAHNISFDIPFLNGVLSRLKRPLLDNNTLCTHIMTRNLIPEIISSNLTYMNKIFNLPALKAHRALADAQMTAHLLIHYLHFFQHRKISKVNQLYYPANKFELHRTVLTLEQKTEFLELVKNIQTPFHLSFKADDGRVLKSFPVDNLDSSIDMIKSSLSHPKFEKVAIELLDNYLQGLLITQKHFKRLPPEDQNELISFIEATLSNETSINYKELDLIIAKHLIPKQFSLYIPSRPNFFSNKLIFKHPKHHKKFLNQVKKLKLHQKKKKKLKGEETKLDDLINRYLTQSQDQYLFLNFDDVLESPDLVWESISNTLKLQAESAVSPFPSKYL